MVEEVSFVGVSVSIDSTMRNGFLQHILSNERLCLLQAITTVFTFPTRREEMYRRQRLPLPTQRMNILRKKTLEKLSMPFFLLLLCFFNVNIASGFSIARQLPIAPVAARPVLFASSPSSTIPYLIERLPDHPNESIYDEIAAMCIEAFFNDGPPNRPIHPCKSVQLTYLRKLQATDLWRRRRRHPDTNLMFVARKIVPASTMSDPTSRPLLLDASRVQNSHFSHADDLVRAEIVGFVEVTLRPYGLGTSELTAGNNNQRPVLTNLSVCYQARASGIGSQLLQTCEAQVANVWNEHEIVLEVEDDNDTALEFYKKRGYEILFDDPTSRRYNTDGMWLRQTRCRRMILRKILKREPEAEVQSSISYGIKVLQQWRDSVFATALTR
jgi:ribosomal protein S18 acetylase RimI-like enzyme